MRLTVGPLPPSVYWRRRLILLVGLAMVIMIIVYACQGPDSAETVGISATATAGPTLGHPTSGTLTAGPSPSSSPSPSASPTPTPTPVTSTSTPAGPLSGPCTDAEIAITIAPVNGPNIDPSGANFTRTITNVGSRACDRDIGADAQEIRIMVGDELIWSSDDDSCGHPDESTYVRTFAPGESFTPDAYFWPGTRSRGGDGTLICADATRPQVEAGGYQVVFRLGTKSSDPVRLNVN